MSGESGAVQRIVLVTGPSGAGRSTAIAALEDAGFEAIDNIPIGLVPRLIAGPPLDRPLALGLDARNRDFAPDALLDLMDTLAGRQGISAELIYLDCRPDVLLRRFSETRRRHPLAPAEAPEAGIEREADLMGPVRARAEILIDTSDLTPHDLRAEVVRLAAPQSGLGLAVTVQSFSYKRGLPRGLDMIFDGRFLDNPYWHPDLRALDGRDAEVQAHVAADPRFAPFFDRVLDLTRLLLPACRQEGKTHFGLGFGCTGGRHRSVTLAERMAAALAADGWQVSVRHRELERAVPGEPRPEPAAASAERTA
ncbi:MAG: RNase adapter RapZ [Rhodosalinus sp.]|uniref:RNase adapter RapZ n=1 Tax=Rhodosalinus sp. TaxID=2047741 RepID=UPI00397A6E91